MSISIGVLASERIAVALVEQHKVSGAIHTFPATEAADLAGGLHSLPCDSIAPQIVELIKDACGDRGIGVEQISAVGVGFPGIIGDGVVLESPNLQQVKGLKLRDAMQTALRINIPVLILNDADAMAARSCLAADRPRAAHLHCASGRLHRGRSPANIPVCHRNLKLGLPEHPTTLGFLSPLGRILGNDPPRPSGQFPMRLSQPPSPSLARNLATIDS